MTRWALILSIAVACTHPEPRPTVIEYEEHGEIVGVEPAPGIQPVVMPGQQLPGPASTPPPTETSGSTKNQPPYVKLKLGHYRSSKHNIGVTIDLLSAATENVADVDPAKLRFDGDPKIWLLQGRRGSYGRTEYLRDGDRTMLEIDADGHATVYVIDPETDRASGAIELYRDADADPLN